MVKGNRPEGPIGMVKDAATVTTESQHSTLNTFRDKYSPAGTIVALVQAYDTADVQNRTPAAVARHSCERRNRPSE